jgi:hypothetical protein
MIEIFLSIIISVLLSCAMAILVVVSLNKKKTASDEEAASSIDELKREIAALRNRIVDLENNNKSRNDGKNIGDAENTDDNDAQPLIGLTSLTDDMGKIKDEPVVQTFYLSAPSHDGVFTDVSPTMKIGKSIYQMTVNDDETGTFVLINTPDAIATAMISVSQLIKPVCKVIGNIPSNPHSIITQEEGVVSKDGEVWKVTRKAVVKIE